jgi:hypothetical protein
MTDTTWAEENGSYGACEGCGCRIWIESGCAKVCDSCEAGIDPEFGRPQTLADVGMCEADFR